MLIWYYNYNNHITTISNKINLHLLLMKQKRTVVSYGQPSWQALFASLWFPWPERF